MRRSVSPLTLAAFLLGLVSAIYWLPGISYNFIDYTKYFVLFVFVLLLLSGVSFQKNRINPSIFLGIGFVILPILFHSIVGSGDLRISLVYLLVPLILLMLVNHPQCDSVLLFFGRGFLVSALLVSAFIVISYAYSLNLAPYEIIGGRVYLPYNPMGFSYSYTIASPTIAAAILLSMFGKGFYPALVRFAMFPVLLCGMILTTGEGGVFGFIVGVGSVFLGTRGRLLGLSAGLVMFIVILTVRGDLIGMNLGNYSVTAIERLASLMSGLDLARQFPVMGAGPGESGAYFSEFLRNSSGFESILSEALQPHASAILLTAELGVFGAIYSLQLYRWVGMGIVRARRLASEKLFVATLICFTFVSLIEPWPLVSNLFLTIWPIMVLAACLKPDQPVTVRRQVF